MKLTISKKKPEEFIKDNNNQIFNFFNLNTIWNLKNNSFYKDLISQKQNINFPDSRVISLILRTKQQRGPTFTKEFLIPQNAKKKIHFFIGLENKDLRKISTIVKTPSKNLSSYNPPYIKELEFSEKEKKKIIKFLKKFKPNYVWVCVGSPKQEILANKLYKKYKTNYFNVGAATDFLLGKKKEAPLLFRKVGLEWFYRFVTDFKYSKKKVWRSFVGLGYLIFGKVKTEVKK